jgi:Caspase domain
LDACRNNPFARGFRSQASGLAQMSAPAGTIIAYATEPGSVAADGAGKNGLYTGELLKAMRTPGLKIEDVFKQVRIAVRNKSQGAQTPWESSSLEGDFYFTQPAGNKTDVAGGVNNTGAAPVAPITVDSSVVELRFWESIQNSANLADFEAYIEKYPNGTFAALARNRIKDMEAAKGAPASNLAAASPNSSIPAAPSRSDPTTLSLKLKHNVSGNVDHDGTLSVSPDSIQWAEEGLTGDQRDNFTSLTCSGIKGMLVALREGYGKVKEPSTTDLFKDVDLADREYVAIYLNDKKINKKGRSNYSFMATNESDRQTITQVGEAVKRTCPGVKITIFKR